MAVQRIRLDRIAFDAGTQVRASIDESTVAAYAERMTAGDQFPAVTLFHDGNQYFLADGFHRVMAAQRNQWREIDATVQAGTKADAIWFALGANRTNGKQMTDADKRHAIELAYAMWPDKGQREIAEQVGCSAGYVNRIRQQIQVSTGKHLPDYVTGKDGKQYPSSRGPNAKSVQKREAIADLVREGVAPTEIAERIGASLTTVTEVRREMGAVVGVDKSKAAVTKRRKDIRDMAERGFSTRQIADTLGISTDTVGITAKKEGIVIHADRVVGKTKRHDPNRIIEQMALQAEVLCADVDLIDFSAIDKSRLPGWLESLKASRDSLGAFIRRLMKEQQSNGEAA